MIKGEIEGHMIEAKDMDDFRRQIAELEKKIFASCCVPKEFIKERTPSGASLAVEQTSIRALNKGGYFVSTRPPTELSAEDKLLIKTNTKNSDELRKPFTH